MCLLIRKLGHRSLSMLGPMYCNCESNGKMDSTSKTTLCKTCRNIIHFSGKVHLANTQVISPCCKWLLLAGFPRVRSVINVPISKHSGTCLSLRTFQSSADQGCLCMGNLVCNLASLSLSEPHDIRPWYNV